MNKKNSKCNFKKIRVCLNDTLGNRKRGTIIFGLVFLVSSIAFLSNIGFDKICGFIKEAEVGRVILMGIGLSGVTWTLMGTLVTFIGHEKFDEGIYLRAIIRGIIYTPLLAFPIVYVFIHHTPVTILESGVLVGVITYVINTIAKIDEKIMRYIKER